jgi:hypothetical protein
MDHQPKHSLSVGNAHKRSDMAITDRSEVVDDRVGFGRGRWARTAWRQAPSAQAVPGWGRRLRSFEN